MKLTIGITLILLTIVLLFACNSQNHENSNSEKGELKIAVEIKSFLNPSAMADFHLALGQYVNYRLALEESKNNRKLYLAVPDIAYEKFFKKEFVQTVIDKQGLNLIVYSTDEEKILKWID